MFSLDTRYSTTRLVRKGNIVSLNKDNRKLKTVWPLPSLISVGGKIENGGLRTQSYLNEVFLDKPLLTVITGVFNVEIFLEETILSVIGQCYENVEYIIIDGGSSDSTVSIIKKYEFAIDFWISEPDQGIYDAMNKGLSLASGSYILFLGSDDKLAHKQTLTKATKFLVEENPVVLFGSVIYENEHFPGKVERIVKSKFNWNILLHNTVHHQSCFYHKSLFLKWKYDTSLKLIADYELNLIIFKKMLTTYSVDFAISICGDNGASRNKSNFFIFLKETNIVRKRHIKNLLLEFLLFTLFNVKAFAYFLKIELIGLKCN